MATILIVDGSPTTRPLARALTRAGYRTIQADNAWRGLAVLETVGADLGILDLILPAMNGLGFLRDLRRNPRSRSLPIIVFTTSLPPEDAVHLNALRVAACLQKADTSYDTLLDLIRHHLAHTPARRTSAA